MSKLLKYTDWVNLSESANGQLPNSELTSISGGSTKHKLNPQAAAAYNKMVAAAKRDGISWGITDSYRSLEDQKDVAKRKGLYSKGGLAATPGTSNHGWGSAVDLAVKDGDPAHSWLTKNAKLFGFSTIGREPWHWEHKESAKMIKGGETPSVKSDEPIIIPGKTLGEKILNNQIIVQWLFEMMPDLAATLTPAELNRTFEMNPEHFKWFKEKFNLDDNGNPMDVPDLSSSTDDIEGALDATIGSKKIKSAYSGEKARNIDILINEINQQGITNKYAIIGILSTIGKESGFIPQNETSYENTSNSRIRSLFGDRVGGLSDSELTKLKKDPPSFYDKIYGREAKDELGWNTGNDSPGDGYKYRGRGFNQITFKSNYQKYSNLTGIDLVSNPDKLNDVSVAAKVAVLFLINGLKQQGIDPNSFKNKKEAIKACVKVNAGGDFAPSNEITKAENVEKNFTLA